MLHRSPTNLLLLAAKKEPNKQQQQKSPNYLLMKNAGNIFWRKKIHENGPTSRRKKKRDKTERVTGLSRRTRVEIVKWNQMTALRFQTGGAGGIRHPRPPFGGVN